MDSVIPSSIYLSMGRHTQFDVTGVNSLCLFEVNSLHIITSTDINTFRFQLDGVILCKVCCV